MRSVAVTAGYVCDEPRREFFSYMDAANIDLKAFTERFYWKVTGGHLDAVLETLEYVHHDTDAWLEITTLLIPGENDSDAEIDAMTAWIADRLGVDVPLHFTAFHPDWKMLDRPRTPAATLTRARNRALANGLRHVYTGNVHDSRGGTTTCHGCGRALIVRDWYVLESYVLTDDGRCPDCGTTCAGRLRRGRLDSGVRAVNRCACQRAVFDKSLETTAPDYVLLSVRVRGGAVWQLVGLITRRSQVRILPPLPTLEGSRSGPKRKNPFEGFFCGGDREPGRQSGPRAHFCVVRELERSTDAAVPTGVPAVGRRTGHMHGNEPRARRDAGGEPVRGEPLPGST